jgi:hypothetical protein
MTNPSTYLVRLKPYNKRRGFLVRNYTYRGVRFTDRWKEVSRATAGELEELIQPHDREAEIPLFEIYTKAEALAVEEKERDAGKRIVTRVKDAEPVPDSDLRNDKPKLNPETGEIERSVEPAEVIEQDPEPAPSMRAKKKRTRKRTSS